MGGLQDDVTIAQFYIVPSTAGAGDQAADPAIAAAANAHNDRIQIVNYETRSWQTLPNVQDAAVATQLRDLFMTAAANNGMSVVDFLLPILRAVYDGGNITYTQTGVGAGNSLYTAANLNNARRVVQLDGLNDAQQAFATVIFERAAAFQNLIDQEDNLNLTYTRIGQGLAAVVNAAHAAAGGAYAAGTHKFVVVRKIVATMSSAILAAPGSDTGALLVGYPFTVCTCYCIGYS